MADFRMRGFQGIPPVIKNLIIINALVWLAEITFSGKLGAMASGERVMELLPLYYYKHPDFGIWQLVTYMFMHSLAPMHILMNMLVLWMFGSTLEDVWGGKRFLIFYLICGVGAALVQLGVMAIQMNLLMDKFSSGAIAQEEFIARGQIIFNTSVVGASGAINGVMAAFAYLFPNTPMYIFLIPVPIKAKYVVIGYFLIDLFGGINPRYGDNVAHFAHVGGAIVGLILVITMNKANRRTFY